MALVVRLRVSLVVLVLVIRVFFVITIMRRVAVIWVGISLLLLSSSWRFLVCRVLFGLVLLNWIRASHCGRSQILKWRRMIAVVIIIVTTKLVEALLVEEVAVTVKETSILIDEEALLVVITLLFIFSVFIFFIGRGRCRIRSWLHLCRWLSFDFGDAWCFLCWKLRFLFCWLSLVSFFCFFGRVGLLLALLLILSVLVHPIILVRQVVVILRTCARIRV